jgi:hypothetical protein
MPEGENLRAAVRWISEERTAHPETSLVVLVDAACIRFDLSPGDGEFLLRFVRENDR